MYALARPVALLRLRALDVDHKLTTAHPNDDRLCRLFGRRFLTVDGATRHVREIAGPHRDLLVASRPEFEFNRTTRLRARLSTYASPPIDSRSSNDLD